MVFSSKFPKETNKTRAEKVTTTLQGHQTVTVPKPTAATVKPIEKVTTVVIVKRAGKVTTTPRNRRDVDPNETMVTVATTEGVTTTPQDVDPTVNVPGMIVITIATTEDAITIATTKEATTTVDATVTAVTMAATGVTTTVWGPEATVVTRAARETITACLRWKSDRIMTVPVTATTTRDVTTTTCDHWTRDQSRNVLPPGASATSLSQEITTTMSCSATEFRGRQFT